MDGLWVVWMTDFSVLFPGVVSVLRAASSFSRGVAFSVESTDFGDFLSWLLSFKRCAQLLYFVCPPSIFGNLLILHQYQQNGRY